MLRQHVKRTECTRGVVVRSGSRLLPSLTRNEGGFEWIGQRERHPFVRRRLGPRLPLPQPMKTLREEESETKRQQNVTIGS